MNPQLVITEDGSSTIFIAALDEHYHSVHGALQESRHVFLEAGLNQQMHKRDTVEILEIGFGTGLNALLTCMEAAAHQKKINYTAVEKYPLHESLVSELNYCSLLDNENAEGSFERIHAAAWENEIAVSDFFSIQKLKMNIEDIVFANQFDLIYFDAFAPSAQPELWTEQIFTSMFDALKQDGILVTYCAKGEVKRTLKKVGFVLEALPGPAGKREMTRAVKSVA